MQQNEYGKPVDSSGDERGRVYWCKITKDVEVPVEGERLKIRHLKGTFLNKIIEIDENRKQIMKFGTILSNETGEREHFSKVNGKFNPRTLLNV